MPYTKRAFKPMANDQLQFPSIFRDGRLRVEKPTAIMDDTGYNNILLTILW